jgi:enterochelin esterase-like enzyme
MYNPEFSPYYGSVDPVSDTQVEVVKLPRFFSAIMQRNFVVDIYLPIGYRSNPDLQYDWLLANDGQDMKAVQLKETLQSLQTEGRIEPIIVASIHAPHDRRHVYGVASQADFKNRGDLAGDYSRFLIEELLTYLMNTYRVRNEAGSVMGFSLGGLQAFDLAWDRAPLFNRVGVFSGSFWWRSKAYDEGYTDADRIMHSIVAEGPQREGLRFWLQTGTLDERSDRDKDGIIDSIGDTRDMIRQLVGHGYDYFTDIRYLEIIGGFHNQETWGQALPDFLNWAFGKEKPKFIWAG